MDFFESPTRKPDSNADPLFDDNLSFSSSSSSSSLSSHKNELLPPQHPEVPDIELEKNLHPEKFAELCDAFGFPIKKKETVFESENQIENKEDFFENEMLQRAEEELIENKGEVFDTHLPPASTAENDITLQGSNEAGNKREEDKLKKKRKRDENSNTIQINSERNDPNNTASSNKMKEIPIYAGYISNGFDNTNIRNDNSNTKVKKEKMNKKKKNSTSSSSNQNTNKKGKNTPDSSDSSSLNSTSSKQIKNKRKSGEFKQIPMTKAENEKTTEDQLIEMYDEKNKIPSDKSNELSGIFTNLEKEKELLNDCLMKINPRNRPYITNIYKFAEKNKQEKKVYDANHLLECFENEDRKTVKFSFFYYLMLCHKIISNAEMNNNILKTTKDSWTPEDVKKFFQKNKYSKNQSGIKKKTKEEIDLLLSQNSYYKSIQVQFGNYRKTKNVKELSSLLPDKIVQNVINNNYEGIEKNTLLLKNVYYIVNAEFSQETKNFDVRVEYLNMKEGETTSESDN